MTLKPGDIVKAALAPATSYIPYRVRAVDGDQVWVQSQSTKDVYKETVMWVYDLVVVEQQ